MISKVQFQDINNSLEVDAEYESVYDFNYGTIETSSEVGILSQEARSVKFKLILDSFLENIDFERELIVVYNRDGGIEFKGFVRSAQDDVSISYQENTISITALDLIGFCQDSGEVSNMIGVGFDAHSKNSIPNKDIILLSLCSGLKTKLIHYSSTQLPETFRTKEWYINQYPSMDIEKYYLSVSNTGQLKLVVRVVDNNHTRVFGLNDNQYTLPVDTEENYSVIDETNIYYYYIIKENIDNESYDARVYTFDTRNGLFGYDISLRISSLPSVISDIGLLHYDMRFFDNVKSIENTYGETGHNYWFNVTDYQPDYPSAYYTYQPTNNTYTLLYTIEPASTQDGNETICWLRNEAKDVDFILAVNHVIGTDAEGYEYVLFEITWLTKTWGQFYHKSLAGYIAEGEKLTGYYMFKRQFAYRGWQSLIIDDPAFFLSAVRGEFSKKDDARPGHFSIRDVIGSYREDLFRCLGFQQASYAGRTFSDPDIVLWGDKDNRDYASNKIGNISVILDGVEYEYTFRFSMKRDRGATNDHFPNVVSFDLSCLGDITLNTYVYKDRFKLSDAFESILAINFLGLFCDNSNQKIVISNKHYIGESSVYAGSDLIDLTSNPINRVYPNTDYYNIFDGGTEIEVLNGIVNYFYNTIYSIVNEELSFTYSNIFSGIIPDIGNNFDYNGVRYSVVSVSRKSENIFDIRAIKNGISTLKFSNDGTTLLDAELSNDGITMIEWNIRTV